MQPVLKAASVVNSKGIVCLFVGVGGRHRVHRRNLRGHKTVNGVENLKQISSTKSSVYFFSLLIILSREIIFKNLICC